MFKILKYTLFDLFRSRWSITYFFFYLLLGGALLFLNNDLNKAIITLMNIVIVLTPLIGTVFGVMYFYNATEFTELLLAQPITRSTIFLGQWLGLCISLSISLVLGLGLPFLIYGISISAEIWNFLILLIDGVMLTFIFTGLAFIIALKQDNKVKGFGTALLLWLFLAIIYDGVLIVLLVQFDAYPIDKFSLIATILNPIDLSRILVLLKLDISALLGYTGALYQNFFGTFVGILISSGLLFLWAALPAYFIKRVAMKKDF